MSKPEFFESAVPYCNGTQLSQAVSVEIEYHDANKPLLLLGAGKKFAFAVEPGGMLMSIQYSAVMPVDSTKDATKFLIDLYQKTALVSFGIVLLGSDRSLISRGYITSPGMSFRVGTNTVTKVGFIGDSRNFDS